MGWYGKLIGGTIGTFILGPLGTILGTAIGHSFDKRAGEASKPYTNYNTTTFTTDQNQIVFFIATFSMLGKMASAGKNSYSMELKVIEDFIDRQFGITSGAEKQFALRIVDTAAKSAETFEKFAYQFYQIFKNQPQMLETIYDILHRVAAADNFLNSEEKIMLDSAAKIFNLRPKEETYSYNTSNANSADKNYSVLGCKRTDSAETIKTKYKKLVKDFHPDVIASKGLPEEFTKFAAEKFSEINQAYEKIRKERGF
jgi:DnaJ like chaperone protein